MIAAAAIINKNSVLARPPQPAGGADDFVCLIDRPGRHQVTGVVAQYHDQGHIAVKQSGFDTGVNLTAGLPFFRVSVDHGTAFDIAWQGKASERSMIEATLLAAKLARASLVAPTSV